MIWMWLAGAAFAGNVYLNGTFIDPAQVAGLEMEDVDVRIDAEGNLHITAPGYKVEVMTPATPSNYGSAASGASNGVPTPAPSSPPEYGAGAAGSYGAQAGAAAPATQQYGTSSAASQNQLYGTEPAAGSVPMGVNPNGIAKASWWMVTEDNASGGHSIQVLINEKLAYSLQSGQPQQIVDISAFLRKGANTVLVKSSSSGASGGTLYVFIGPGSDQSGTVVMDKPEGQFGVGSSRTGAYEREYAVQVN